MAVGRLIGVFFVLFGIAVLGRDLWVAYAAHHTLSPIGLGQLWYQDSPSSLTEVQQAVEHDLGGRAWDVIAALMNVWAFLALMLIGVGLLIAFRRRLDIVE
jgi:hypothetical protein